MNRVYEEDAVSFNQQLQLGQKERTVLDNREFSIPKAVEYLGRDTVRLNFYAPQTECVKARIEDHEIPMEKGEHGIWTGTYTTPTPGFKAVFWIVDGTEVLNPMAPVGFGWSKPINYVDFPEEEQDFYQILDVPHGTAAQEFYYSRTTGQYESCMVYLPPDYMKDTETTYPVLYLQHGHGENEKCWVYQGKVNFIMDNLLAGKEAAPCIIVMNNGMVHTTDGEGHAVMDAGLLEDLLIKDCIPFIEKKYRVRTDRDSRAMGTEDPYLDVFRKDNEMLEEKKLMPEHWEAHRIFYYPGSHEWQVWRKCIRDFLKLVF